MDFEEGNEERRNGSEREEGGIRKAVCEQDARKEKGERKLEDKGGGKRAGEDGQ